MRRLITLIALLGICVPSFATSKKGTAGAQFLKIGAGARPTAMGDAFVAVADDANAVYHNPAGLGFIKQAEITAMHTEYLQGLNYDFGAYVQPFKESAIAISAMTLQTDQIARRNADESQDGTFQNQDASYALSYGRQVRENLSLGLSGRWIREEIAGTSAQTWSGDLGLLHKFQTHPASIGLAIRNLGGKVKFVDEGDPLPLTVDTGLGWKFLNDRLLVAGDVRHVLDSGFKMGIGTEWSQNIMENKFRYAVRAGYNSANTDAGGANGISLGGGLGYRQFTLDFAWVPFGDLGNTFRYAATFRF